MSASSTVRRSRRARTTTKRYSVEGFADTQSALYEISDSGSATPASGGDVSDKEFGQEQPEESEQQDSEDEVADETFEEQQSHASEDEDEEPVIDVGISSSSPLKRTRETLQLESSDIRSLPAFHNHVAKAKNYHIVRNSRGTTESWQHGGKSDRILRMIGPGSEDLMSYTRTRDKWLNEATLPTRGKTENGPGGVGYSFYHPRKRRERESNQGWEWYEKGPGRDVFTANQINESISWGKEKILFTPENRQSFLVGPVRNARLYHSDTFGSLSLSEAWSEDARSTQSSRSGWILNAGFKVHCLEWAPSQSTYSQYLLVSPQKMSGLEESNTTEKSRNPKSAFLPGPPGISHFQIWEISVPEPARIEGRREDAPDPKLLAIIKSNWNSARRLKWCPVPRKEPTFSHKSDAIRLGLLAGVWKDGYLRVLDINIPVSRSPSIVHIERAAFEFKPPDTICTSFTWLSSSSIAAGCANGCIAIWNLSDVAQEHRASSSGRSTPRPWFYKLIHHTYIINIISGYPSRPHFIFSAAIDGHSRATDLRDPSADMCMAPRNRLAQQPVEWHDQGQMAILTDENFTWRGFVLRQFHSNVSLARCDAMVTDVATSPMHPCVLGGCVDGAVWSSNVLRKVRGGHKERLWMQVWFKYEWRRGIADHESEQHNHHNQQQQQQQPPPPPPPQQEGEQTDNSGQAESQESLKSAILGNALGRFTEGYRIEQTILTDNSRPNAKDGVIYSTVFEEESAISRVAWNPNLRCATWAAAATGTGLIRIEDVAVDNMR